MRSLVRGAVIGAFGIAAVFGTAGPALAGGHSADVDGCQTFSCNASLWIWNFSDDDTQGMNFGSVIG